MRLFIAIQLPAALRRDIAHWALELAGAIADPQKRLHWVKEEQFHVTLKFLGNTKADSRLRLCQELLKAAALHQTFKLSLSKLGHFGGRVVWLGLDHGAPDATRLAQTIEERCEAIGFARETRTFHPHITLARSKVNPGPLRLAALPTALSERIFPTFEVNAIALIQSTLTPRGAIYETLDSFLLQQTLS